MTRRPIEAIPAIDLIDGQCVRLKQGDYNCKTVYGLHPEETAQELEAAGFERLHVVDLDGARAGHCVNLDVLRRITATTHLRVDYGGGVKTEADVESILEAGAHQVTIGSLAVTQPELVARWAAHYGADRLIIGADVREGRISIHGWQEDSQTTLDELLSYYTQRGVRHYLCTDISRDGMLQGPATSLYVDIMRKYPTIHLIASGGISCTDDILQLEAAGIPAVVFGKAYYEGRIDPDKILRR